MSQGPRPYACLASGVIIGFMSGVNLTMEDCGFSQADAIMPLPDGDWDYGDTLTTVSAGRLFVLTGVPNNKLGQDGDAVIDVATGNVYRKDMGSWL